MRALRPKESRSAFYPDITDAAWGVCVSDIIAESPRKLTIICLDSIGACESFYGRLEYFLRFAGINARVKFLPESGGESASAAFDALCERTGTLNAIVSCAKAETSDMLAVICTPESIFEPAGNPSGSRFIELRVGQKIKFDELKALLSEYGYYNETVCETVGQFAVRGEIIDVYPIAAAAPCRIDFFGDEIESIRNFDPDTQLTDAKIERIRIDAVAEGGADSGYTAYDYIAMSPSANWIFLEPDSLCSKYFEYFNGYEKEMRYVISNAKKNAREGLSVEKVVDVILKADRAKKPKLSYTVGLDAYLASLVAKLPQGLINNLIKYGQLNENMVLSIFDLIKEALGITK